MRLFGSGRRRRYRYEPEGLGPEQDARDARVLGRRYFVYVLSTTSFGTYVGHSARPQARLREHLSDPASPVAGGDPQLIWVSRPFRTRRDAAAFEAAMKELRQRRARRFEEITGVPAIPFRRPPGQYARAGGRRGSSGMRGCLLPALGSVITGFLLLCLVVAVAPVVERGPRPARWLRRRSRSGPGLGLAGPSSLVASLPRGREIEPLSGCAPCCIGGG